MTSTGNQTVYVPHFKHHGSKIRTVLQKLGRLFRRHTLRRTKLAKLCDIDKAQISRIVNDLCSKGYVTEPESENVNYRKRLKLTPLGRDTAEGINEAVKQIHSFVSDDIPEDQIISFYSVLDLICEKLKQAEDNI